MANFLIGDIKKSLKYIANRHHLNYHSKMLQRLFLLFVVKEWDGFDVVL
uniref:Uncharacterized protein n=1 Tax=Candidatus Nitrotoga fabula TaxID=2182327 RepID=A0A2X0QXJ6_9PROT|nr:protein of unknown function [Candidatus Nitrotoga fabula]